jgi:hypothetical protein
LDEKVELVRPNVDAASVDDVVEFVHGDALDHLRGWKDSAFCFLDAEKEIYGRFTTADGPIRALSHSVRSKLQITTCYYRTPHLATYYLVHK